MQLTLLSPSAYLSLRTKKAVALRALATSAYGLLLGNNTGEVPLFLAADDDDDDIEANGTNDCTELPLSPPPPQGPFCSLLSLLPHRWQKTSRNAPASHNTPFPTYSREINSCYIYTAEGWQYFPSANVGLA